MNYLLVGLNHKTAPVQLREKAAFDDTRLGEVLSSLVAHPSIKEATILSTCNRVELYSATKHPKEAEELLQNELLAPVGVSGQYREHLYVLKDSDVVSHLFEVTSSLDSQVTGENQITGQVRDAFQVAQMKDATGYYLNQLFDRAFYVAKRVKTETDVGRGHVSASSVAVVLAKKIFGSLKDRTIVLFGAGKMSELALKYLQAQEVKEVLVFNRTWERALELEKQALGRAVPMDEWESNLLNADVLMTSISGQSDLLTKQALSELMSKRKGRSLFVIDLGVPRNVAPEAGEINDLFLYNIDDLGVIAEENKKERARAVDGAKSIIDEEVKLFYEKHIQSDALPAISQLGKKFEQIRLAELERTFDRLPHLSVSDQKAIDKLTQVIVNRVLHDPILSLKTKAEMQEPALLSVFKKIFRLDDEEIS